MNKKYLVHISELSESTDGLSSIKKEIDMNIFYKLLAPSINKALDEITAQLEENLNNKISALDRTISDLKKELNDNKTTIKTLVEKSNYIGARNQADATAAINNLCSINKMFVENVRNYGKSEKLDILEMLVKYLFNSDKDLKKDIMDKYGTENTINILTAIDDFNDKHRQNLLSVLSLNGLKWEDCVKFPDNKFDPKIMAPFNTQDITAGDDVYIVALGFNFPFSNCDEYKKPTVFKIGK